MRRICSVGITLAVICTATTASAGGDVAVAVLGVDPGDAPDVAARLTTALKNQVSRTPGYKQVQGKALDEIKLVFGCVDETPDCMARVGRSLQADRLLWGSLQRAGKGFTVTLQFLDVARAQVEKVSEPISDADAAKPAGAVERLTSSFLVVAQGKINLTANVTGAQVLLGTSVKGVTDGSAMALTDVPAGTHVVQVRKDGYRTWIRRVAVAAGQSVDVAAKLELIEVGRAQPVLSPPPPPVRDPRKPWKIAFWSGAAVSLGLSVGMIASGAGVLSLQSDKEAEVRSIGQKDPSLVCSDPNNPQNGCITSPSINVCDAAESQPSNAALGGLRDICSKGTTRATIFNALLGAAIISTTMTGYFLYKGYLLKGEPREASDEEDVASTKPRWHLQTGASPHGAHVGLSVDF